MDEQGARNLNVDRRQLVELRNAVNDRVANLRGVRKRMEGAALSTAEVDERLLVLEGTDEQIGLVGLLSNQIDIFEAGFDAGQAAG